MSTDESDRQELQKASFDKSDPEYSLLVPEKRLAISAIKLKLRTTAAELATESGLSTNRAGYWLNKIAGETGARLDVAGDGTIYYQFAPNFTSVYIKRGVLKEALALGAFFFQLAYWFVRVSFGIALILSILAIIVIFVLLIFGAIASIFEGGGHSGDIGGGHHSGDIGGGHSGDLGGGHHSGGPGHLSGDLSSGGNSNFFDPEFFNDLFKWDFSPSHGHYTNSLPSSRRDQYSSYVEKHPKGTFLLEIFSFLFGDGKPNSNLQEIRWQKIARVIKANGGVVSAEQLAPYLDGDTSDSGMIMNALAHFNGYPRVTESGFIVYVFPDFLGAPNPVQLSGSAYLEEEMWRFSNFPATSQFGALTLAIFNFCGSWWLFKHIATVAMLHPIAGLIDVLFAYSVIFLIIPAIRFMVLVILNMRIDARNARRQAASALVSKPQGEILKELEEAGAIREKELAGKSQDSEIIFTSGKELLEQEFEKNERPENN